MATTDQEISDKSDSHMRHEDTVSLVKSIITSEFRELKRDLSINNTSSKSSCIKRKYVDDAFVFKYAGNKKQFDFNVGILKQLAEIRDSLESSSIEDIEGKLDSAIKDIEGRLKLIRIADKTEGGWITVDEYENIFAQNIDCLYMLELLQ